MNEALGTRLDRGMRIVANAGGLNPGGSREARRSPREQGSTPASPYIDGDDLTGPGDGSGSPRTASR